MTLNFKKMHGLGNDFVILDGRENDLFEKMPQAGKLATADKKDFVRFLCDRKRGVGCDQLVILRHSKNWQETVFLDMYNADGSVIEACGNMTRCVADILMTEEGTDSVILETLNGSLNCWKQGDLVRVEMGKPKLEAKDIPLSQDCDTLFLEALRPAGGLRADKNTDLPVAVNMGNPHCVFFVDDVAEVDVAKIGAHFEVDPLFPNKTNVEFVQILAPDHVRMRVWERAAGITEACGSGACAVVVAAIRRGLTERKVTVTLDGGDLVIDWPSDDAPVSMTGPVTYVFDGTLDLS